MKLILAAIVCIGLGGFLLWLMGPSILSDLTADETQLQPTAEYRIDKASCKTRIFIIGSCDVDLVNISSDEKTKFDYLVLGRMGGESVYPLEGPDGFVTTNIGLEYAVNRLIMLILFGGGLLIAGLFVLYTAIFNPDRLKQTQA